MANIMTKRGNQDNVITYEHICDTTADMANIEPQYKTLGSVCIVIKGESGGLEVYMMGSNKEWVPITEIAGGSSGIALPTVTAQDEGKVLTVVSGAWNKAEASGGGSLVVHINTSGETPTLDKKAGEIFSAYMAGQNVVLVVTRGNQTFCSNLTSARSSSETGNYNFEFTDSDGKTDFSCTGMNDYPTFDGGIPNKMNVSFSLVGSDVVGDVKAEEIYNAYVNCVPVNFYIPEEGQNIIRRVVVADSEEDGSYFFFVLSDTSAYTLFEFEASDGDSYPVLVQETVQETVPEA